MYGCDCRITPISANQMTLATTPRETALDARDLKEGATAYVPVWSAAAKGSGLPALVQRLKSSQTVGLISLIGVITLWLVSSMLTQDILRNYNKPLLMTFVSVISMQAYFVFLRVKDPLLAYLEAKSYVC